MVDLSAAVRNLLILVIFDTVALVLSGLFLYRSSNINIYQVKFSFSPWPKRCVQVYLHLMKEYGLVLGCHQAWLFEYLFCTIAIACAFDFTLKFDWVLDREEWAKSMTYATNASTI